MRARVDEMYTNTETYLFSYTLQQQGVERDTTKLFSHVGEMFVHYSAHWEHERVNRQPPSVRREDKSY